MPKEAQRIIQDVVEQADRAIVSAGEARRILLMMQRADRALALRLAAVIRSTGGPQTRFEAARLAAYQAQVRAVTAITQSRLGRSLEGEAKKAVATGLRGAVRMIGTMERVHTGAPQALGIEKAQVLDSLSKRRTGSLLMQHERSVERYGRSMVLAMERELMTGLVLGEEQWRIVERLTGVGMTKTRPGMFVEREWMARRIVVTECAYAANAIQFDAIVEARKQFPDMAKKIMATFDSRTAADSVYVHGQIRDIGELFVDGAGRQYEHPPARPHDREIIIPWRKAWPELPITRPLPADERAAAKVACMPSNSTSEAKRTARKSAREAIRADREKAAEQRRSAKRLYGVGGGPVVPGA